MYSLQLKLFQHLSEKGDQVERDFDKALRHVTDLIDQTLAKFKEVKKMTNTIPEGHNDLQKSTREEFELAFNAGLITQDFVPALSTCKHTPDEDGRLKRQLRFITMRKYRSVRSQALAEYHHLFPRDNWDWGPPQPKKVAQAAAEPDEEHAHDWLPQTTLLDTAELVAPVFLIGRSFLLCVGETEHYLRIERVDGVNIYVTPIDSATANTLDDTPASSSLIDKIVTLIATRKDGKTPRAHVRIRSIGPGLVTGETGIAIPALQQADHIRSSTKSS